VNSRSKGTVIVMQLFDNTFTTDQGRKVRCSSLQKKFFRVPECRTLRHPVSPVPELKEISMPESVRYRNKVNQSSTGLIWYRTEIMDAGIPMPAASALMPMPRYAQ
jgi:hypothetical protein